MLSGPENMPVFSDNQITPDQKKEIIAYVQYLQNSKDPGGAGLGRIGPVSEGLLIWVGRAGRADAGDPVDRSQVVSRRRQAAPGRQAASDTPGQSRPDRRGWPRAARHAEHEAMIAGAEVDGVYIVHRRERFPIAGTRAEKRAERTIAGIFLLAFLAAVAFIVVFCGAVPVRVAPARSGQPGLPLLHPAARWPARHRAGRIGIGMVLWAKWLLPRGGGRPGPARRLDRRGRADA